MKILFRASLIMGVLLLAIPMLCAQSKMSNETLERIFSTMTDRIDGPPGDWKFIYNQRPVSIITDSEANRIRIYTPIMEETDVPAHEFRILLEANFLSALDAKYGLYNGSIVSVYMHPLEELEIYQVIDAINQVTRLAENFGTNYSSTEAFWGSEAEVKLQEGKKRVNQSPSRHKKGS